MTDKKETCKANSSEENMCDSCEFGTAECCSENHKFGDGIGGDNIIECDQYSGSEYEYTEKGMQ